MNNENKHHCQSGEGLTPAGDFSADLSVFQAHLPGQIDITAKPLVCNNSPGRQESGNAGPLASHNDMTYLTVDPWIATVIAVAHPQSVSRGTMLDWRPIMTPSSVAAGGGVLASGVGDQFWIMGKWMLWFEMNGLPDEENP